MDSASFIVTNIPAILVFITVFLLCYYILARRNDNFPPGPRGLPIIGAAYFFNTLQKKRVKLAHALVEETGKYGDIIGFKTFGQSLVYLHGYDAIHDAFVKHSDITSDRPHWLNRLNVPTKEGKGIVWQSGHEWKVIRKFVLQTLRDFGVGKTSIEDKIKFEVDAATDYLIATEGEPTDPRLLTSMIITNVIYGIVFAKRHDYVDEKYHTIIHNLDMLFVGGAGAGASRYMKNNWINRLLNGKALEKFEKRNDVVNWVKSHIYQEISEHEATFDNDDIRDFVDLYIQAKKQENDSNIFNKGNMFRVIMDLFIAGSETTSNTINWCLLFMQENPDVQKKCQDAIQEKCGSRQTSWSDRTSLPYIEATLLEIQRMANIAPTSLPHTNEVETTISGFTIPRRTLIFGNLYSSNMDPRHWDQPTVFNPERFLASGKLKKIPAFMPFSTGPRICLGETLARMEMFLVFTNLLQKFTFMREDENVKHSMEIIFEQQTSCPLPYKTRAVRRY